MSGIIGVKHKLGLGLDIKWNDQLAEELHKHVRNHFQKRRVMVNKIDEIWAADLVDMQKLSRDNKGVQYLLTVIDVFSKYGWIWPLKNKTGLEVESAFKNIFAEGRVPERIWVDMGKEFYNSHVRKLLNSDNITMYSTENEEKITVVERWNRTMKNKMYKYFTTNQTRTYVDVLPEMTKRYNHTKHRSIVMTPIEASNAKNSDTVYFN